MSDGPPPHTHTQAGADRWLLSSCRADGHRAAAGAGAAGASVLVDGNLDLWGAVKEAAASAVCPPPTSSGYNPHASLYGVGDEQTSGGVDLLILLLNVLGYLLQHLTPAGGEEGGQNQKLPFISSALEESEEPHLLISRLHAEEDEVRRGAGQAALQVRLAPDFLRLCVKGVQRLHGVLEQRPLDLDSNADETFGRNDKNGQMFRR